MFIYYPMILCHAPMEDRPIDVSPIGYVDTLVGNVVQALERAGIRENTILVWTTDNGPQKGKATEDGACVPLIVNGPGLVPSGVVSDALVDITDMLPTFAALGGASPPARYVYDGQSMADLFTGKAQDSPRQWIMAMGGGAGAASTDPAQPPSAPKNKTVYRDRAIRDKQFKLYIGQDRKPEKMIDLLADPNEKNNILDSVASGIHSDPAAQAALEKFLAVEAGFPAQDANPHCAAAE
ncbi:MAG: Choline-sulfatase [candidate division BRC1 bacterium ADurb.BinA364]|nr:MAG: Choline-sulfatase [candidate division BRC1 bacterium ADurb.BinA364]